MKGISSAVFVSLLLLAQQPAQAINQGNWGSQSMGAVGNNSTGNVSGNPSGSGAFLSSGIVSGGRKVSSSIPHTSIGAGTESGSLTGTVPLAFYPTAGYYAAAAATRSSFDANTSIGVTMDVNDVWF